MISSNETFIYESNKRRQEMEDELSFIQSQLSEAEKQLNTTRSQEADLKEIFRQDAQTSVFDREKQLSNDKLDLQKQVAIFKENQERVLQDLEQQKIQLAGSEERCRINQDTNAYKTEKLNNARFDLQTLVSYVGGVPEESSVLVDFAYLTTSLQDRFNRLQRSLTDKEEVVVKRSERIHELETKSAEMTFENFHLRTASDEAKKNLAFSRDAAMNTAMKDTRIQQLEAGITERDQQLQERDLLIQRNSKWIGELSELSNQRDVVSKKQGDLEDEVSTQRSKRNEAEGRIQFIQTELTKAEEARAEQVKQVEHLTIEIVPRLKVSETSLQYEVDRLMAKFNAVEKANIALKASNTELRSSYQHACADLKDVEKDNERLTIEKDTQTGFYEAAFEDAELAHEGITRQSEKISELEETQKRKTDECRGLVLKRAGANIKCAQRLQENGRKQKEISSLEHECQTKQAEIERLQHDCQTKDKNIVDMITDCESQKTQAATKVQAAEARFRSKEADVATLHALVTKLHKDLGQSIDLQSKAEKTSEELRDGQAAKHVQIQSLQRDLENAKQEKRDLDPALSNKDNEVEELTLKFNGLLAGKEKELEQVNTSEMKAREANEKLHTKSTAKESQI